MKKAVFTYQEILDHLLGLGNPEIAEHSQRFFKTAKGDIRLR